MAAFQHSHRHLIAVCLATIPLSFPAAEKSHAVELYRDGQAVLRWDNTITYSTALRIEDQNQNLISDINSDEGNRSFDKGVVSNRFDLLTELGFNTATWGLEISGAAWYDSVYNTSNNHTSPETHNSPSVPHNRFTKATRKVHGRNVELLNAYAR